MGRVRGKKPTRDQIRLLEKYNKEKHENDEAININEWLYYGEEFIPADGSKHAAKNSSKRKYVKFIHRETAEIIKVLA